MDIFFLNKNLTSQLVSTKVVFSTNNFLLSSHFSSMKRLGWKSAPPNSRLWFLTGKRWRPLQDGRESLPLGHVLLSPIVIDLGHVLIWVIDLSHVLLSPLLLHFERSSDICSGCLLVDSLGKWSRHVPLGGGPEEDQGHAGGMSLYGLGTPQDFPWRAGRSVRG